MTTGKNTNTTSIMNTSMATSTVTAMVMTMATGKKASGKPC